MSMDNPPISIGLPVYNGQRFLAETLDSLLAQAYSNFELTISDNASTDQTQLICLAYAAKDTRIRYHRTEANIGFARNFNRVFALSNGKYFKLATADDLCKPTYLGTCLEVLENDPTAVLAYPRTTFVDEFRRPLNASDPGWDLRSEAAGERFRYVMNAGHWVNAISGLIRAEALAKTRLMPSYAGGDYRLLGELSLLGKFIEIPEYLHFRRLHAGASSANTQDLRWITDFFKTNPARICLSSWNLALDHLITIVRSHLSIREKLSLLRLLLRGMRWRRDHLLRELTTALHVGVRSILQISPRCDCPRGRL